MHNSQDKGAQDGMPLYLGDCSEDALMNWATVADVEDCKIEQLVARLTRLVPHIRWRIQYHEHEFGLYRTIVVPESQLPEAEARGVARVRPEILTFKSRVEDFCHLIEHAHELSLDQRIAEIAVATSSLYAAACRLPVGHYEPLAHQSHWPNPHSPAYATLSDVTLELHRFLLPPLVHWETVGTFDARADAVWDWRSSFLADWGDLAVGLLAGLHSALLRERGRC